MSTTASPLTLTALALVLAVPAVLIARRVLVVAAPAPAPAPPPPTTKPKSIMQPPAENLAPPKDDPFTPEQLAGFDGSDPSKPIYVAIKGDIFDVTHKVEVYGKGKSYNIFAGKDGSKGLGLSSLKPEDAISDYSDLGEKEAKVLDDWHSFFSKRYNIVGRVVNNSSSNL